MPSERDREMAEKFLRTGSADMVGDLAAVLALARQEERAAIAQKVKYLMIPSAFKMFQEWLQAKAGE